MKQTSPSAPPGEFALTLLTKMAAREPAGNMMATYYRMALDFCQILNIHTATSFHTIIPAIREIMTTHYEETVWQHIQYPVLIYCAQRCLPTIELEQWYLLQGIHLYPTPPPEEDLNSDEESTFSLFDMHCELWEEVEETELSLAEQEIAALVLNNEHSEISPVSGRQSFPSTWSSDSLQKIPPTSQPPTSQPPSSLSREVASPELVGVPAKKVVFGLPALDEKDPPLRIELFDRDYPFFCEHHGLARAVVDDIYHYNQRSHLVHDLGYSAEYIASRLDHYRAIPQPAQKSIEWLRQRTDCITASALADALGKKGGERARLELLLDKASWGKERSFDGNFYTRWGERYEDVAGEIYCHRFGVTLHEFGMLRHQHYPFLGASTDGVSSRLINLEIKCPPSRTITGVIPEHYWMQIQLQLEVLDLPLSHFLELGLEQYNTAEEFYQAPSAHTAGQRLSPKETAPLPAMERGVVIECVDPLKMDARGTPALRHYYSPIAIHGDPAAIHQWWLATLTTILAEGRYVYVAEYYWRVRIFSCINVQRDSKWFQEQLPHLHAFWEEVEHYRQEGTTGIRQRLQEMSQARYRPPPIRFSVLGGASENSAPALDDDGGVDDDLPRQCLFDEPPTDDSHTTVPTTRTQCLFDDETTIMSTVRTSSAPVYRMRPVSMIIQKPTIVRTSFISKARIITGFSQSRKPG